MPLFSSSSSKRERGRSSSSVPDPNNLSASLPPPSLSPTSTSKAYAPLNLTDMDSSLGLNPHTAAASDTDNDDGPLPPPRPFFLANSGSRGSWSSYDSYSSADPISGNGGSDSESPLNGGSAISNPATISTPATTTTPRSTVGGPRRKPVSNSGSGNYASLPPGAMAPRRESTDYNNNNNGNSNAGNAALARSPSPLSASPMVAQESINSDTTTRPTPSGRTHARSHSRSHAPATAPPSSFRGSSELAHPTPLAPPKEFNPRPYDGPINPDPVPLVGARRRSGSHASSLKKPSWETLDTNTGLPISNGNGNGKEKEVNTSEPPTQQPTPVPSIPGMTPYGQPMQMQGLQYPPIPYPYPMPLPPFARPGAYSQAHNAYLANSAMARASAISFGSVMAGQMGQIPVGMQQQQMYGGMQGMQGMQGTQQQTTPSDGTGPNGEGSVNGANAGEYGFPAHTEAPITPNTPGSSISPGSPSQPLLPQGPNPVPTPTGTNTLPRTGSTLREPFLSPASRAGSSLWQPPPNLNNPANGNTVSSTMSWYSYPYNLNSLGYAAGAEGGLYANVPGGPGGPGVAFAPGVGPNGMGMNGMVGNGQGGQGGQGGGLVLPSRKEPLPSSALRRKLSKSDKPWLKRPTSTERWAWWTTFLLGFAGIGAAAVYCFFMYKSVPQLGRVCLVFEDDFSGNSLDTTKWSAARDVSGGGNGEFQIYTDSSNNLFVQDGSLFIKPTLTSDSIGGTGNVFNGYTYTVNDCTDVNTTNCAVTSDASTNTVIPPVMSARISTMNSTTIKYGRVEVSAKLPNGDWLWPAIWMLPKNNAYGPWPVSGELDIMESRGNSELTSSTDLAGGGSNVVSSSLVFGPVPALPAFLTGYRSDKRVSYGAGFHTYGFEWNQEFMRFYVDERTTAMLLVEYGTEKSSIFTQGNFPATFQNGSVEGVVKNPWPTFQGPYDQDFYLIMNVAVGGNNGYFQDSPDKPWTNGGADPMTTFAQAQSTWFSTWPTDQSQLAMQVDSVKMYELC